MEVCRGKQVLGVPDYYFDLSEFTGQLKAWLSQKNSSMSGIFARIHVEVLLVIVLKAFPV